MGALLLLASLVLPARIAWADPDGDATGGAPPISVLPDGGAPITIPTAASSANAEPATAPGEHPSSSPPTSTPAGAAPAATVAPAAPAAAPTSDGASSSGLVPLTVSAFGLPPLQVHAFVSQGFIKSTNNNYLVDSTRGSFEFTEVGLNFTQVLTDQMRMGMQLFARRLGTDGSFAAQMDWLYLDYRFADWFGLRAGRTKIPFGMYNEAQDVDSARVPILLPQAVYPILNRNLLLAQTGLEAYGYFRLGPVGGLEYRLYGGTLYSDPPAAPAGTTLTNFTVPYIAGGRLMWDTPIEGLRAGGSAQILRFDTTFSVAGAMGMPPTNIEYDLPFVLWLASAEYTVGNLVVAGEYGRWRGDVEITGAPTDRVVNERYYAMASYRLAPWFTPGVYYSSLTTDIHKPNTQDNYQRDAAATLRFDLNEFWLVKLEGHYISGTTDLATDLNGGRPLIDLTRNWSLFLAKTTAYF